LLVYSGLSNDLVQLSAEEKAYLLGALSGLSEPVEEMASRLGYHGVAVEFDPGDVYLALLAFEGVVALFQEVGGGPRYVRDVDGVIHGKTPPERTPR